MSLDRTMAGPADPGTAANPGTAATVQVSISNRQAALPIDETRLRAAVRQACNQGIGQTGGESMPDSVTARRGSVSLAVVDNCTIHELNRQFLQHDYPTDVLSFLLDQTTGGWEGEVIVSAEMAGEQAARYGWDLADELLLYVIHGTLHLVGYDDLEPAAADVMRAAELRCLQALAIAVPNRGPERRWATPGRNPAENAGESLVR